MLKDYSPVQNTSYRLVKACYVPVQELKKYKPCTKPELLGVNYLFWCWMYIQQKEPHFLFGQCTIYNEELYFGVLHFNYAKWAKSAYERKWIDLVDRRGLIISFKQEDKQEGRVTT
jgi:hypothetical protein